MIIERLIEDLGKLAAKVLFNKEEKNSKKLNLDKISSTDLLRIILKRLIVDGKYNEAENILFQEVNKSNSEEVYELSIEFYNLLLKKSDKELQENNFTRMRFTKG